MPLSEDERLAVIAESERTADYICSLPDDAQDLVLEGCHSEVGVYTEKLADGRKGSTWNLPKSFVIKQQLEGVLVQEQCILPQHNF